MATTTTTADLVVNASTTITASGATNALTGLAWTSSQTVELDFNVANTDQVTPMVFVVELIQ